MVTGDPYRGCRELADGLAQLSDRLMAAHQELAWQSARSGQHLAGRTGSAYRARCEELAARSLRVAVRTDLLSRGLHTLAEELTEARGLRLRGERWSEPELATRAEALESSAQESWLECLNHLAELRCGGQ